MKIKRRTFTLIINWTIKIIVAGAATSLLYCYFGTNLFTITTYEISGIDEDARRIIDTELHEYEKKKLYRIFPANKIFTYSNTAIIKTVSGVVPEMATISVRPNGLHTVKIEITLLKPLFRVSGTQALTENGIIFSTKYSLRSYPRLTIASSTTTTVKSHGLVFTKMVLQGEDIDNDFLLRLSDITAKISSVIFPVENVIVDASGDVLCIDERGVSKVIFLKDSDYKKTWSTLVSAIDTDPLKTKLAAKNNQLEYLDARYGNKIFYRFSDMAFQNGSVTGILGSHASTTKATTTLPQ